MPPRKRLGQLLTELGVVDEHQLQSALGHQKQWGGKIGAILVQKGFCKEDAVVSALSKHLGLPAVRISEQKVDPRALKFVSRQIAEKLHVLPYEVSGSGRSEVVTVAMSDPTDLSAVDQLAFHTGKRIKPILAGDSEIVQSILLHYGDDDPKPAAAPAAAAPKAPAAEERAFPRRIDPSGRQVPPAPQPRPAEQPLEEIPPPAELLSPEEEAPPSAAPVPVDLPDAEEEFPLEPIAAHTQGAEQVAGAEEVEGAGNAADEVEGLVHQAGVAHAQQASEGEGTPQASWEATPPEGGWEAEPLPAAESSWDDPGATEQPAVAGAQEQGPADGWTAPAAGDGWGAEEASPAPEAAGQGWDVEAVPGMNDQPLPTDAILGPVGDAAEAPAEVPPDEAAFAAPPEAAEESWARPAQEPQPEDSPAPARPQMETRAEEAGAADAPSSWAEAAPEATPPSEEAEAPDAWGASEDPLAGGGEPQSWAAPVESGSGQTEPAQAGPAETGPAYGAPAEEEDIPIDVEPAPGESEPPSGEPAPMTPHDTAEFFAPPPGVEPSQPSWEAGMDSSPREALGDVPAEEPRPPVEVTAPMFLGEQRAIEAEEQAGGEPASGELPGEERPEPGFEAAAPAAEGEAAPGWYGEVPAAPGLSPADLGTLASVGVDPNDVPGALRALAALVRVLNRRQLLDIDELAAEIREGREHGLGEAASAEASGDEQPAG